MDKVSLNGVEIFPFDSEQQLLHYVDTHKGILVAINAEKILHATEQTRAIINRNIGYCDGAGAQMALKQKGYKDACKIPGCELWLKIITRFYKEKTFYLVGGKPQIVNETVEKLCSEYQDIRIVGYRNGYIKTDEEKRRLIDDIVEKKPDVVFVAMGSPKQELLMEEIQQRHRAIFQGLGGSFDVYTGHVQRAPKWWVEHNLEFAYRLIKEPKRIKRQIHLVKYAWWLMKKKIINRGNMKKVMLVFGTRPEAIKMAPLVKEFQKQPKRVETVVCVTGQHREMLDQVLKIFDIKPDYDLNIMKQGQDLYDVTARVLTGMRDVLKEVKPDVVLVHGDTTTSTAAALAAFYQQIPVGHVEAGLRTHNIYSPWPEEMNRLLTGRLATYHFSPTPLSRNNLIKESVDDRNIIITGNTVIDALYWVVDKIKNNKELDNELEDILSKAGYDVNRLNNGKKLVLITGHRRENFGDGFINMCTAIKDLTVKYPDLDFVYPMHLNPNVRKPIHEVFGENLSGLKNMFFIEPLEYLSFVYLMEKSSIVLTDSGGIQEEAPGLGKPVLVMRDTTERPEALDAGTVKLVGTDYNKIVNEVSSLIDDKAAYEKMSKAVNPYGDGLACGRIVNALLYRI